MKKSKLSFGNAETTSPTWGLGGLVLALCALCITLSLTSCNNDEVDDYSSDPNAVIVNATIGSPLATRVNTDGTGSEWLKDDQIHVQNTSANAVIGKDEAVYKFDNNVWALHGSSYMVWADGDNTFQAYYPYGATDSQGNVISASYSSFTLPADQSSETLLRASDWMTADTVKTKPDDKAVNLTFSHQLAKVTIVITGYGNEYGSTTPTLSTPQIIKPSTQTEITNKTVSLSSGTAITPYASTVDGKQTYTAVVIPSKYTQGDKFFTLTVGDNETLAVLVPTGVLTTGLESGKAYTFNVTVGKDVMTITNVSVED